MRATGHIHGGWGWFWVLAELPRGRLRQSVGTDPPSPPDPASHHLREPLLPSNMPFYQLCPLREGARLPWRGPSPPRSLCPAERPSRLHRTSGLVVDEGRAENGDPHSRAPGGRDHREPQPGAGWGRRAARQAGDGAAGPPRSSTADARTVASRRNEEAPPGGWAPTPKGTPVARPRIHGRPSQLARWLRICLPSAGDRDLTSAPRRSHGAAKPRCFSYGSPSAPELAVRSRSPRHEEPMHPTHRSHEQQGRPSVAPPPNKKKTNQPTQKRAARPSQAPHR